MLALITFINKIRINLANLSTNIWITCVITSQYSTAESKPVYIMITLKFFAVFLDFLNYIYIIKF